MEKKTRARFAYTAKRSRIPVVLPRTHGAGLLVLSPGVGRGHAASLDRGARALAGAGVRRLLLREPSLDAEEVWRLARGLLRVFPRDGLLLHEKCAGARAVAASLGVGLHLSGAADWAAERARFGGRLGVSAHSAAEVARAAELGMQWAFLSPVFQPASKPGDTRPHLGERAVVAAQAAHPGLTLHALGGVTPEAAVRLADCLQERSGRVRVSRQSKETRGAVQPAWYQRQGQAPLSSW